MKNCQMNYFCKQDRQLQQKMPQFFQLNVLSKTDYYFNYEPRFNGAFSKSNLSTIRDGAS